MPLLSFLVVSVISQFTARVKRKGDKDASLLHSCLDVKAVAQLTITKDLALHVVVEQLDNLHHLLWDSMVPQYLPE